MQRDRENIGIAVWNAKGGWLFFEAKGAPEAIFFRFFWLCFCNLLRCNSFILIIFFLDFGEAEDLLVAAGDVGWKFKLVIASLLFEAAVGPALILELQLGVEDTDATLIYVIGMRIRG